MRTETICKANEKMQIMIYISVKRGVYQLVFSRVDEEEEDPKGVVACRGLSRVVEEDQAVEGLARKVGVEDQVDDDGDDKVAVEVEDRIPAAVVVEAAGHSGVEVEEAVAQMDQVVEVEADFSFGRPFSFGKLGCDKLGDVRLRIGRFYIGLENA